ERGRPAAAGEELRASPPLSAGLICTSVFAIVFYHSPPAEGGRDEQRLSYDDCGSNDVERAASFGVSGFVPTASVRRAARGRPACPRRAGGGLRYPVRCDQHQQDR